MKNLLSLILKLKTTYKIMLKLKKQTPAKQKAEEQSYIRNFKGKEAPAEFDTVVKEKGDFVKGKSKPFVGYKYPIKKYLAEYDIEGRKLIKEEVMEFSGISESTYKAYINLKADVNTEIPPSVLLKFSKIFRCTLEDLLNA